jgi:hypothetical protein
MIYNPKEADFFVSPVALRHGKKILHLSGIRWMFFRLFVLLPGNMLPDIVDS